MAIGGLIAAYQEDDNGSLHALIPARWSYAAGISDSLLGSAGAAPIVIVVERVPQALQDVFERLRLDGLSVFPVSDLNEALSRFEAGSMILMIGDGIAPPADLVTRIAEQPEAAVATVADDEAHEMFERIDVNPAGPVWRS